MPTATLSSKYQITIPMEIVRSLGLKPGEKIAIEQIEDRIVMLKEPASWVDYFRGSMKGVYGSTKEEIDRYVAEIRYGWDIDALKDALALEPELRAVYDAVSFTEARSLSNIAERAGIAPPHHVHIYLRKLEELQGVKRLEHPTDKSEPYYRRIP